MSLVRQGSKANKEEEVRLQVREAPARAAFLGCLRESPGKASWRAGALKTLEELRRWSQWWNWVLDSEPFLSHGLWGFEHIVSFSGLGFLISKMVLSVNFSWVGGSDNNTASAVSPITGQACPRSSG